MAAQTLDGAAVAQQIKQEVAAAVAQLKEQGITPGLAAVLVGDNPASQVYVGSKVRTCEQLGLYSEKHVLSAATTTAELLTLVHELNQSDRIDGILVQLPLPKQIDTRQILEAVSPAKDVDGFHPVNVGRLVMGQDSLVPCTPAGIIALLERSQLPIAGQRAVVIGRSDIVGKPMALLLLHRHATVTICHSRTSNLPAVAREADILVTALGQTALITADYVKPGAVVIDVGMNKIESATQAQAVFADAERRVAEIEKKGYTLIGDVNPKSVAPVAGYLTPVPGGVGPLTIAMLMSNTLKAAKRRRGLD